MSLGAPVTSIQPPRCSLFWCRRERFHWDGPSLLGMEVGKCRESHMSDDSSMTAIEAVPCVSVEGKWDTFFCLAKSALGRGSLDGSLLVYIYIYIIWSDTMFFHHGPSTSGPNESPKIWGPSVCESPLSPKVFLSGTGFQGVDFTLSHGQLPWQCWGIYLRGNQGVRSEFPSIRTYKNLP